jgi:tetratricopeptide (TPR) repeat protein
LENHLSLEVLAKLLAGDLGHEELVTQVIPHFLGKCPGCRRKFEEISRLQEEVGHWDERVAVMEGPQATDLFAALKVLPFEAQLNRVLEDESFQTWGLCQLLLRKSLESGFEDAAKAVNYAELAVKISQHLEDTYDPHWVLDLRARAHAHLGNAWRVLGELRSAEMAFREAERFLSRSMTGNEIVAAEVLHLKASLRMAQRRFPEAIFLVDQALGIYREQGDVRGAGVSLLKKAKALEESDDLEGAIQILRAVVGELDTEREAVLSACASHNLLLCLVEAGHYLEAGGMLPGVRALLANQGKPLNLIRLRWTEGKIELGKEQIGAGVDAFREVQGEFLERGMGYDAALVSLDLAILYARERRTSELKRLAAEMAPIFESRDVHREALAALLMFQKACEEERVTVELATQLALQLRRERRTFP